eukprot:Gb_33457 [translate_table: standard]
MLQRVKMQGVRMGVGVGIGGVESSSVFYKCTDAARFRRLAFLFSRTTDKLPRLTCQYFSQNSACPLISLLLGRLNSLFLGFWTSNPRRSLPLLPYGVRFTVEHGSAILTRNSFPARTNFILAYYSMMLLPPCI